MQEDYGNELAIGRGSRAMRLASTSDREAEQEIAQLRDQINNIGAINLGASTNLSKLKRGSRSFLASIAIWSRRKHSLSGSFSGSTSTAGSCF
jgi:hypothetical protein